MGVLITDLLQCFLCETQNDFYELCYQIKRELVTSDKHPLFEICEETPKQWEPPLEDSCEEALGAAALSPSTLRIYFKEIS